MSCPPIIFLIFNRPQETARVFSAIRAARPAKLLVVADGPRDGRVGEAELCAQTRKVIDRVDWPCEVLRDFAQTNMGCGRRVSSGITRAFEQVETAIILEDDCLPDPSFFPFCAELLKHYENNEHVMMISGNNFQNGIRRTRYSYYFSHFPRIWGWASWRRAWQKYDFTMQDWGARRQTSWVRSIVRDAIVANYWNNWFDGAASRRIDTWAYQWTYTIWGAGGLAIVPNVNLVTNIGFGETATHTRSVDARFAVPSEPIEFPLRHPKKVSRCKAADRFEQRRLNEVSAIARVHRAADPLLRLIRPHVEHTRLWTYARSRIISLGDRSREPLPDE